MGKRRKAIHTDSNDAEGRAMTERLIERVVVLCQVLREGLALRRTDSDGAPRLRRATSSVKEVSSRNMVQSDLCDQVAAAGCEPWSLEPGTNWYLVTGMRYRFSGYRAAAKNVVPSTWYRIPGTRYLLTW